jgi:DUF1680 family protein
MFNHRSPRHGPSRRLLLGAAPAALLLGSKPVMAAPFSGVLKPKLVPLPLESVRLLPSPYLTSVEANRAYLHKLEPDRLLHNFRTQAGLEPKGAVYGGWESDTIAGHTLGHYMTALALMYAQTGDEESKRRLSYILDELALCQAQDADGFVAGFSRKKGDRIEHGKLVFDEVRRGEIQSRGFDLNGCWVPLYTWHKMFAGILDADRYCGFYKGIPIAEKLAAYIDGVFADLNDEQIQKVLDCEHGGINESFAELYVRTGNRRWLALAEKIYHRRVLGPLSQGIDCLSNIHANTQIPKIIGLARLHEITGAERHGRAASFFWETVTRDYSYVIGGNADREYFQAPRSISKHITEQTCESCNTYNMLKLTRHLYAGAPEARYFDYYERAHLNHIMAHQNPKTGMFAYMVPLMTGSHRDFSSPFDDFWCCVGSGMESHSKHGESIYWHAGGDVTVNLYIPSTLAPGRETPGLHLETQYPFGDEVVLTVTKAVGKGALSLRVPGWCQGADLSLNGQAADASLKDGYIRIPGPRQTGDVIRLTLPRSLRLESAVDDPNVVALLYGPMVLAGDLGPSSQDWKGLAPVLVGSDLLARLRPTGEPAVFKTDGIVRPGDLTLRPFTFQHERNTAVYFQRFTDAEWVVEQERFKAEQARLKDLQDRSADVMHLGEMQAERDHDLDAKISYPGVYRGRNGRDARSGGYFEFTLKTRPGPLLLQSTYWGEEQGRKFKIMVDGTVIATEQLNQNRPGEFFERDYPIPEELTRGKDKIRVRFEPETGSSAGPCFGVRLFSAKSA